MTKTKSTKRALLMSALSLLMCVSMLIGSTFAWFTDSVTSASNIIKAGSLDVEMYWAEAIEDPESASWIDASTGPIFNYDLWEPGYVDAKHIKIANVGSLAFSYQLRVVANGTVSKLGDVIDVYYFEDATQLTRETAVTGTKLGTLTEIFGTEKNLSNAVYGDLLANTEKTVTIAFKMQESAGNEYQNLSVGTDFSVELIAVQHTYEKDSFDENYDKNALSAAVPAAFVRELEDKNITATLGIGGSAENFTLDAAYQFQPTQSYEELMKSEYKYYLADFIVSADEDVPANSIALAGYYDAWCKFNNDNWVAMVNDGLTVAAGQEIGLVEALGAAVHYKDICEYGNDGIGFLCGVADLTGENAGTTITVKLCLFETTADPNGSSASSEKVEGSEPIVIGEFKYTFPEKPWDGVTTEAPQQVNGIYQVGKPSELAWLAASATPIDHATLTADIDMRGATISSIEIYSYRTFDGAGHTISNVVVEGSGLFGNISTDCTIKNIVLDNITVNTASGDYAGIVNGKFSGRYEKVTVTNSTVNAPNSEYVGGLAGAAYKNIIDCKIENISVTGTEKVGGLVGFFTLADVGYSVELKNCSANNVTVTATNAAKPYAGVFFGRGLATGSYRFTFTNCSAQLKEGQKLIGQDYYNNINTDAIAVTTVQ